MPNAFSPLLAALHGHAWTLVPRLWHGRGLEAPPSERWATRVREHAFDRDSGLVESEREVTTTGLLSEAPDANTLVIVLHGCGGAPTSHYAVFATRYFLEQNVSVLRLAWRGADLGGEDIYHAAQTADVHAAIADPRFARYERIWLLGYSLGGHCCLHVAHETRDPRVRAVATVCPVLHLQLTNDAIDAPARAMYRRYVLGGLLSNYVPYHQRGHAPTPLERVKRATTFRAYDALTVVPRYGFSSVDDYYDRACASRVLGRIERPTLIVSARHDPMLPWTIAEAVRPSFSSAIHFLWAERGGHAGFPRDLDLGEQAPRGLEPQVHAWLERNSARGGSASREPDAVTATLG
ncbi:MAG: Hydrolase, alpha/beta fold family protein [Myxococcaceae bacterium]|nr:Hydrolase, alpha/beta fold family protein [Myxococcaceae bacterium]